MSMQSSAAVAATGQALQESSAFSHGATNLVRSWSGVFGDACQVVLIGLPIDEPGMMLLYEHLPFGTRKTSRALLARARRIQRRLLARFAIGVGAGIDGVGEHMVDSRVARIDPAEIAAVAHLQWNLLLRGTTATRDAPSRSRRNGRRCCESLSRRLRRDETTPRLPPPR